MDGVLLTAKGNLNNLYGELGKSVFLKIVFNNYFWIHLSGKNKVKNVTRRFDVSNIILKHEKC